MVLYCHGWPGSRLEASLVPDLPVRLLAVDRPGYGNSDAYPRSSLQLIAADLRALTRLLGLEKCVVIGVSGGGPLAAAMAHDHPDLVSAVALVSAVPPPEAAQGDGLQMLMRAGRNPLLATPPLLVARNFILRPRNGEPPVFGGKMAALDREMLTAERRRGLIAAFREGLRPGIAGVRDDARLYGSKWGFSPADIQGPVAVWHGAEDHLIQAACAASLATSQHATLNILPEHGHYSPALMLASRIIEDLLQRSANATGEAAFAG